MQQVRAEFGSTVVVFTLYGLVTAERLEREQALAKHRAEQLGAVYAPKRLSYVPADVRALASAVGRHGDSFDGVYWCD